MPTCLLSSLASTALPPTVKNYCRSIASTKSYCNHTTPPLLCVKRPGRSSYFLDLNKNSATRGKSNFANIDSLSRGAVGYFVASEFLRAAGSSELL